MIAVALAAPLRWAISRTSIWSGWYVTAALTLTMLVLLPVYSERASYLGGNTIGLRESRQGLAEEAEEFSALLEKLKQLPPGRVYAGQKLPSSRRHWSDNYYVSYLRPYALLQADGLDMMGHVYHSYSLNSDLLIDFDERRRDHYNLYNARYVVAPESVKFPEFVIPLQQFGRHRLYEVDTTGYFDWVGSDLTFAGETPDLYLAASTWLGSRMPVAKKHPLVSFGDPFQGEAPLTSAIDLIPEMDPPTGPPLGTVMW
ncbi:MAG TPA: hypothetical protein DCL97_10040 [Dehalococcoidia bacterium]|nr:hypothetical protein [Dehalococcoidia bacterium]